jgi:hypothetical protein
MTVPTLLDIAKSRGSEGLSALVEEVQIAVPEIRMGAARTIKGIQYKQNVRTELPGGSFRNANEGSQPVKSTFEERLFNCFIANPIWTCDKAVADAHEDGAAAYIAAEAAGITMGQFIHIGRQFYYGTGNDAKGFPGLLAMYDADKMTVDATGSTPSTGSSVWFVKWGPQGLQFLYGNNGDLRLTDVKEIVETDQNGKRMTAYHQEILAWVGLKLASLNSVVRIKNLTAQDNKGLTDALMADAMAKFPVGWKPDVIFASRRSITQLRKSRTATTETGKEVPTPQDFDGIPIIPTDSISNTEAIA